MSRVVLTEAIGDTPPPDLLQHEALAEALAEAICSTPVEEPLGIALYGSWGQGKSTIGSLLRARLLQGISPRVAFVRVEAWRYAHAQERGPLRRHFLLEAYEAVGKSDDADRLRERFTQVTTTTAPVFALPNYSAVRAMALTFLLKMRKTPWIALAILVPLIFIAFPRLWQSLAIAITSIIAAILLISTLLLVIGRALIDVLAAGLTVTAEAQEFQSVEEFDRGFDEFLASIQPDYDRLVIFIDDLDRCLTISW